MSASGISGGGIERRYVTQSGRWPCHLVERWVRRNEREEAFMGRKTATAPPPDSLTARIETVAQTYFVAVDGHAGSRVEDEAILNITSVIESIGPRHQRFVGQPLEMDVICARSFAGKELTPKADKPMLLPLELRKDRRSLMVYLPSDAFWGVSRMTSAGLITHVEASFSGLRYGTADLLSVHFSRKPQEG
jgi:hypothetical protein